MGNKMIEQLEGPLLFGMFANFTVFGVVLCQSSTYFHKSSFDAEPTLYCVAVALIVTLCAKVLTDVLGLYSQLVANFGNFEIFNTFSVYYKASLLLSTFPVLTVQVFLTWRVFVISKRNWLALAILSAFVLACAALNWAQAAVQVRYPSDSATPGELRFLFPTAMSMTAATNIVLTGSFIGFVLGSSKSALSPSLRETLHRLAGVSLQSALPVTLSTIITLIAGQASKTGIWLAFNVVNCPLYSTAFFFTLNSRDGISKELSNTHNEIQRMDALRSIGRPERAIELGIGEREERKVGLTHNNGSSESQM
ncbi:hypothetical protein T439DRAFT_325733, partial [Meredithblackwellia eburnea MCA 4105]